MYVHTDFASLWVTLTWGWFSKKPKHVAKTTALIVPYILESNPHAFYSFRGLKNQMRIRLAVVSWILEKW